MTALAADRRIPPVTYALDEGGGLYQDFAVTAATVIYKGGFVGLNTAGTLVMQSSPTVGTTVVGGTYFVGMADEAITAAQATAGKKCRVKIQGLIRTTIASSDATYVGAPVYCTDSGALGISALGNPYAGYITNFISTDGSNQCNVMLEGFSLSKRGVLAVWTPIIAGTAANIVRVIPANYNIAGLQILRATGICTTTATDGVVYTLQDSDATTTGVTFTTSSTVAGDKMIDVGSLQTAAASAALTTPSVAAGKSLDIKVTTTQAAGAAKFYVEVAIVA